MQSDIAVQFGKMIVAGHDTQRKIAERAESQKRWDANVASVPAWIKAKSTEELGEMWANHTDECLEFCDDIWWELIARDRGDLCPI